MPTLSPELAVARRTLDYRATMALRSPLLASVHAFASGAKKPITVEDGERGRAMVYIVDYNLKFLTGPGAFANRVTVRFDIAMSTDYPIVAPGATVVSSPKPWSPHVLPNVGSICIGEIWENAHGKMLIAHLVAHVARVFNCDEEDRGRWYSGWNADAVEYWRRAMNCGPVTPGLAYPVPPTDITHPGMQRGPASIPRSAVLSKEVGEAGLRRALAGLRSTKSLGGGQ